MKLLALAVALPRVLAFAPTGCWPPAPTVTRASCAPRSFMLHYEAPSSGQSVSNRFEVRAEWPVGAPARGLLTLPR